MYCISIGLMKNQEVILGVVYEMAHNECFYATKGGGAYMNKQKIKVSETSELKKALIATGFPTSGFEGLENYMSSLEYLIRNSSGVRRYGSAAADLAYVACGRYDAFYEIGLSPWDVAAGTIILEEAGGICSDFNKKKKHIFGKEIIASNSNLYQIFSSLIKKNFL
jgi:myo-inositol-1(or 4)-monophosphatase